MTGDLCVPLIVCPSSISRGIASDAAGAVIGSFASGFLQAAEYLARQALSSAWAATEPGVTTKVFIGELRLMRQVGLLVVLPVLCAATIGPVLRQDGRRILRVWGVGLPVAVAAGALCVQFTHLALSSTDYLCAVFAAGRPGTVAAGMGVIFNPNSLVTMPSFVQMALAVLVAAGALMVWLELLVRSAGVYVATFFMPLALVAYIWPATAGIARRAVEILVALIMSKFVIVASLSLGLALMTGGGPDAALTGCGILLLAAFSPFVLFRLTPVVEASAIAHMEGLSRRPLRSATAAAGAVDQPVVQMVMRATSNAGTPSSGVGVAEAMVPRVPEATANYPVDVKGRGDG